MKANRPPRRVGAPHDAGESSPGSGRRTERRKEPAMCRVSQGGNFQSSLLLTHPDNSPTLRRE